MPKREIDIPDELESWVMAAFGDVSNSRSEAYRMALAYAKRQYELEDKRADGE